MDSNSKFVVKKDNFISQQESYDREVRQGDGLSPLLFNIFINDISNIFDETTSKPIALNSTEVNCLIYADDLVLLSEVKKACNPVLTLCKYIVTTGS